MNGVVVYDHTAGYELLKGVPLIYVTGKHVSDETLSALRRCIGEGSVCVAWGPLAVRHGFENWTEGVSVREDGTGKWVLTDDFGLPEVYPEIWRWTGHADKIRYRFGDHSLVIRRIDDNKIEVEVDGVRR